MKKGSLLQYALIITGVILGYQALQSFLAALISMLNWVVSGGYGNTYFSTIVNNLLFFACIGAASWLLIMRSGKMASYIAEKTEMDNAFNVTVKATTLMQIVLVSVGVIFLLSNLPYLINDLLDGLREKNGVTIDGREPILANRFLYIIQTVLAAIVIGMAKPLAIFLTKTITAEPFTLSQKIEDIKAKDDEQSL